METNTDMVMDMNHLKMNQKSPIASTMIQDKAEILLNLNQAHKNLKNIESKKLSLNQNLDKIEFTLKLIQIKISQKLEWTKTFKVKTQK